jgi:DNA-binding beta-propeller fold protein YncE
MKMKPTTIALCVALFAATHPAVAANEALRAAGRTELPGYTGDFDHFEYDLSSNRLWLAAEDHGTLDLFDLKTGKLQRSFKGIVDTPHGILYLKQQKRLIVTDSGGADGLTKVIDAATYKVLGTLKLAAPAADAMAYDASAKRLYIVNGGRDAKMQETYLSAVDPFTLERLGDLKFDTEKVEAMAIEQKGNKLYINVTAKNYLAVVDKQSLKVLSTWPIKEAEQNAPLAFDEPNRRLFVITRKPGKLIVLNADTGATITSFKAPERCDQVIWDAANRRVYALGGEGYIGVFQQKDADHYDELARVPTAVGAKTGILVPELKRLYVAVSPGEGKTGAAVLRFEVAPAPQQQFYRLQEAVTLKSASPDWDYVTLDQVRGYLFIARRADGVTVYDVKAKKIVRTIEKSEDANAVCLVPEFDRGYTTNGDGTTTAFELSTLRTIGRIKFGEDADSATYDPVTKQIAFTMGDSKKIAFVDAKSGKVVGDLSMDGKKLDGMAPDGEGNLFMALRDRESVAKIDIAGRKLTAQWKTEGCEQPTGLDYDRANKRIFVGCRGSKPVLAVMDAESGKVIATHEIGRGNDGVIYESSSRQVYTSNGVDGNLVIYDQLDANTYRLAEATTTRPYARTMAFDRKTKRVYLVTAEGTADPAKKINKAVAPFYPNRYYPDTFTVLTFAPKD